MKYLFLLVLVCIMACSQDDDGTIIDSFPLNFRIDEVNDLGVSTFHYTDSIIYLTGSDFTMSIEEQRSALIKEELFNNQEGVENFSIKEFSFTDQNNVSINAFGSTSTSQYSELSGIGSTMINNEPFGFKINPDLNTMLSCYTIVNKRTVDSLFEGQFLPELDTLFDQDSSFAFQLLIEDDPTFTISACHPYDVSQMLSEFSQEMGLANNDRIIVHRTDFIYKKQ